MIFPYREELRGAKPRFHPLVPITVHGALDSIDLLALVDSGAEHSVLTADLADVLGISLRRAEPVLIVGAGEHEVAGRLADVDLELDRYRWQAPVVFAEGPMHRPLLGQIGFFAFFTVTFRYHRREMDIRRIRGKTGRAPKRRT
jgi:hypothetical protein